MKYVYPAIFRKTEEGHYSICFPDVGYGATMGETILDGIENAEDFLALSLYMMEKDGKQIPPATELNAVKTEGGEFVTLIAADTDFYYKWFAEQAATKEARKAALAAKKKPELAPVG